MLKYLLVLLVITISACTTVDHSFKEPSWPDDMMTIVHWVPHKEMRDRCNKYAPPGTIVEACAEWNYNTRECHIWLSEEFGTQEHLEHELLHCKGFIRHN